MKNRYFFPFLGIFIALGLFLFMQNKTLSKTYYAMGTNLTITIAEKNFNEDVFQLAFNEFKRVESIFKNKVDLNNKEVLEVFKASKLLQKETNGVFSPYLSDVIKLWQFDRTNKTINKAPTQQQINEALLSKKINLYAIAKGYGIDKVADILKANNINNFIVDAGGDLLVKGSKFGKNWNIGLKHSNKTLTCNVNEFAIATSSNLYNAYMFNGKKYGHLINGNTGWPTQANKTISIIAKNATIADGLATAIFVDENLMETSFIKSSNISMLKQDEQIFSTFNLAKNCIVKNFGLYY